MAGEKILIVEDEGIAALDLQYRLISMGYTIPGIASSGEEAVKKAEEMNPDLVLMDIMLEGKINGVKAAEQIRYSFDVPVIYITAYADDDTVRHAKLTEPFGYIIKPFQERELQVTIDIALYKHKMEKRLRQSEKWLATTLTSIGDAVVATDKNGLITFMNPVAEGLMGWKLKEVVNRKLTEVFNIVNRDTRQPVENPVAKVFIDGITAGLANHTLLIARDGSEIPIDDSAAPIKDDKGNIMGVVLVFRDITEREKSEAAILREKSFTDTMVDSLPGIFYLFNDQGRFLRWNKNFEKVSGYSATEMSNLHPLDLFRGKDKDLIAEMIREVMIKGESTAEATLISKSGSANPYFFTGNLVLFGEMKCLVGMGIDITERKTAEEELKQLTSELKRSNADLQQFANVIAHDLQTPLIGITLFANHLAKHYKDKLDEKAEESIHYIIDSVERTRRLIKDLLEYSRLGSKTKILRPVNCSVVLEEAIFNLRSHIEETCAEITYDLLPTVKGDSSQLISLFQNLIVNAIKFRSNEPPKVYITAEQKGDEWIFSVHDNGIGIDPKYFKQVFIIFQRLHASEGYEGTGIGLAICKKIVERHGGRIWVASEPGKGSTFYFAIPNNTELL